jgi:hypothetical protein
MLSEKLRIDLRLLQGISYNKSDGRAEGEVKTSVSTSGIEHLPRYMDGKGTREAMEPLELTHWLPRCQ